jgi:hypothetical protein
MIPKDSPSPGGEGRDEGGQILSNQCRDWPVSLFLKIRIPGNIENALIKQVGPAAPVKGLGDFETFGGEFTEVDL